MLDNNLRHWLDTQADALDRGLLDPEDVLPQLAQAGVLGQGVDSHLGGAGGDIRDAVERVADIASHSLTAAFVLWGQRSFIEYLLNTDNAGLRERLLGDLLSGQLAGATGLSNAMKHLAGLEALGVNACTTEKGWTLSGRMPWVTNLRKRGFVVAAAAEQAEGPPLVVAIPDNLPGVTRSADLQLLGLQSSNTAALHLENLHLQRDWLLASDARQYLSRVRPTFLGLQCGMAVGLARRSLEEVELHLGGARSVLEAEWRDLKTQLATCISELKDGLSRELFRSEPIRLFRLRIALAELSSQAVQLELQASGGKAYLLPQGAGFARRWRESAFVPIVTPSLVQLRGELQRHTGKQT